MFEVEVRNVAGEPAAIGNAGPHTRGAFRKSVLPAYVHRSLLSRRLPQHGYRGRPRESLDANANDYA